MCCSRHTACHTEERPIFPLINATKTYGKNRVGKYWSCQWYHWIGLTHSFHSLHRLLVFISLPVTTAGDVRRFEYQVWCEQHSGEWKRGETGSVLVGSGEGVQVCGGVEARAAPRYAGLYAIYHHCGTGRMCDTH